MKDRFILALIASITIAMLVGGCDGSSSSGDTYTIDSNGTIPPLEDNQVLIIDHNVSSVVVDNGGINISCNDGSTCNVHIGDNTTVSDVNNTDTTDSHNSDSHTIDNHATDDNSVTNVDTNRS